MTKLTYREQLQHPNWQRKRLEALDHYGFECQECGTADNMLHVHHRQYVKGRSAWEYSVAELNVLCDKCHKAEHEMLDQLRDILMDMNPRDAVSILLGYQSFSAALGDREGAAVPEFTEIDPHLWAAGAMAGLVHFGATREQALAAGDALATLPVYASAFVRENSRKGAAWARVRPVFESLG
jgi:hypothetical protein